MEVEKVKKGVNKKIPVEFLMTLVNVFNPNAYPDLCKKTTKTTITYLINIILLASIIMLLFSLPMVINIKNNVHEELDKFSELSFDANMSTKSRIYFDSINLAIEDKGNISNEKVFINDKSVQYCISPLCRLGLKKPKTLVWQEYRDLSQHTDELSEFFVKSMLLLLPVILFGFLLITIIRYIIIAVIFTGVGILLLRILNKRLQMARVFKTAIFALTPAIILNIVNITLRIQMYYLPLVISGFYFVVGTIISAEKGFKS